MQSTESDSFQTEYPSSVFTDEQSLICADGYGTLHVLTMSSTDSAKLLGVYELPSTLNLSSSSPTPFRLHSAWSAGGQAVAVLSFKCLGGASPHPSSSLKAPSIEFDVVAVRVPLHTAADDVHAVHPLDVLWRRRGATVPFYVAYEKRRDAFMLAGGSPYRPIEHPTTARNAEPSPDDLAPIPRAGADDATTTVPASPPKPPPPPPPYAWTQDSEEITMAIPLPSSTPTSDISVLFSPQTLTLLVQNCPSPRYTATRLWASIAPSSSFWTWDAHGGGARAYGLLTLHLEKQHAGTRWPHVFDVTSSTSSSEQPEIAETLDPSELYAIRESLEKYTAALQETGATTTRPSLADGEMDEEVDSTVGTESCITWVVVGGGGGVGGTHDPKWTREDWGVPFTMLSTPLPGLGAEISMVVKHTIDGLWFVLSSSSSEREDQASGPPVWTHASTFSALAFVLASKRDTRFTYHVSSKAVLAFEGGGAQYGGNLYIYREAKPKKSNVAKQAILKLTGDTSGSLLGVGATHSGEQAIVLCLCEKELLVLRNVL
jgi:hypothetical protein